jgi:hypothetical protein
MDVLVLYRWAITGVVTHNSEKYIEKVKSYQ